MIDYYYIHSYIVNTSFWEMVRLYIIRHGDPDYLTDRANGGSLTDHGKAEAKALAQFLAEEGITDGME